MHRRRTALWVASIALVVSACTIRDDGARSNQLESLRVLAIASEPGDVVPGETLELTALVYEPDDRPVSYQWSWCLSRGDSEQGYTCTIDEADLQGVWADLNTGVELPSYDLGREPTAFLDVVFSPEQAFPLCEALTRDEPNTEVALFTCLSSLGLSVELRVSTEIDEIVAIRDIPFAEPGGERNTNPQLGPGLTVYDESGASLGPNAPLLIEGVYQLEAEVDAASSESFIPEAEPGLPPPEQRGESLFISWFVTTGATHRSGEVRTSFFDGGSLESLVLNTWEMPFELENRDARLFLVLRDERGGIDWAEHSFTQEEAN